MNVLIASDYSSPYGGNFIASMLELGNRLKTNGDDVLFLFPFRVQGERDWAQWIRNSGFEVCFFDTAMPEEQKVELLQEIINRKHIDILHLHFGMLVRTIRQNRANFLSVKVLIHDHMDYSVHPSLIKQKLKTAALSLVYRIKEFAVITVMEKKLKGYIFCKRKWYVPNGLSLQRNIILSADRKTVRNEIGVEDDQILCLILGWDMERKGIDIAVNAVHELREDGINAVLGLVGLENGLEKRQKEFIAERCNVSANSPWIKYLNSREDMYALHRAADVFLSASRKEGFSYGLLEAISQSVPVVVSDIDGTKWSWDYSRCFQYSVEDWKDCANAIKRALKNKSVSNGEEIVERYSIQKWCDKIVAIYHEL